MKKFYFLFLFALIASIGNLYAAEVVLWEEDFSSNKLTGYVVGNGGGTTKIMTENLAKGTAPELLIAKKGGYLQVTVSDLKGLFGKMTLTFKSNKTDAKFAKVTTSTTGVTVSTPTNSSGVWTADFTVTEGVTSLTFKVENSDNTKKAQNGRYDDFKLVGYEADTKCATPTFNLTAGATYTDVQDLVITSTTEGAQIEYKIEGGKLTAPITGKQASPATVHLTANDTYMVTATATKEGLDASESEDLMFTIAKKMNKPTFNLTEGAVYGEAKVLEITSDKVGAQIEYTVIGGGNISITKTEASPVKVTLNQNGDYTVEAFALGMDDYAKSDAAGLNFRIELAAGVPTFSVEEGTYPEAQTIALAPGEGGEEVFYTINDGTEQPFIEPIKLEEEGIYKIAAYTAATETLAKSASVTKTYIINFPLDEPYILCEDAAWLTDGAKIIFVGKKTDKYYGLSVVDDNIITGGLVTISEKNLTEKDAAVKVFVVGRTANGVTFNTAAGYLAAGKTAKAANLSYAAGNEGDCFHWTVSVANGEATVVNADVTGDYNNLQFNPSAKTPRFGAYADSYKNGNLSIYLLGSTSSVSSMSAEGVKAFAAEGGVEVVADEAADVAVYTVAGQLVRQARVAEGSTLVNVAPGFYVVRANGTATKVIVR
ncbi:MAG: hypothetical protein EGQ99_03585 [Porphyromonadaceae bacterium]|nr:hypothetical protein [Porphyromonadaceae bacterium]